MACLKTRQRVCQSPSLARRRPRRSHPRRLRLRLHRRLPVSIYTETETYFVIRLIVLHRDFKTSHPDF